MAKQMPIIQKAAHRAAESSFRRPPAPTIEYGVAVAVDGADAIGAASRSVLAPPTTRGLCFGSGTNGSSSPDSGAKADLLISTQWAKTEGIQSRRVMTGEFGPVEQHLFLIGSSYTRSY